MSRFLAIVGPTACGKSALALAVAEALAGEIVNGDALQVYRGFDIGTAKPRPAERLRVRHHLVDILDPRERYSAGEFARRARAALSEIRARDRLPIVVGGSGLYLRALIQGLSPLPPTDPELRDSLRDRLESEGLAALRERLRELDPVTEARLAPGDTQRVLRALEVRLSSGRPLSAWIAARPTGERPLAALQIGLTLPRAILYDRIERRVERMVAAGWVEEVASLLAGGLDESVPAFQAIGYSQLARHVRGEWSLEKALSSTARATRRFAKRQITWFRREGDVRWFATEEVERESGPLIERLRRELGAEA